MKKKLISFLSVVLIVTVFTGCKNNNSSTTPTPSAQINSNKEYKQSPILTEKSGLPELKDRLPKDPKIENEMPDTIMKSEIGTYGGTLRTSTSVISYDADVFVANNEALLNTPGLVGDVIVPNIVKKYDMSADEKEFTFYLREGLKWSDGVPVTMEDFRFTMEDVIFNKEMTPIFPDWLSSGGKVGGTPLKFEIINEWTFKITFDLPYGGILTKLAVSGWRGYNDILKPAHYLKPYHKKYAIAAELEAKIKEAKFAEGDWIKLFTLKDVLNTEMLYDKAIGFPCLNPWVFTKKAGNDLTMERNPYYFKVDKVGNQLPYIDYIVSTLVQDIEMVTMKTISGEVDFSRESAALIKMPLYKDNEKKGYKALVANMHNMPTNINLNLTYNDPVWRQVTSDIRFRKALNFALNRTELISTIYYGHAKPSTLIDSTFDISAGNKLLDEMGMKKGADGFRLSPEGKDFSILIEIGAQAPDIQPMAELVAQEWQQLGLKVTMKKIEASLWSSKIAANNIQATVMWAPVNLWYQANWGQANWGALWNAWRNSGGKKGEEPPSYVKDFFTSMTEMMTLPPEKAKVKYKELEDNMKQNLFFFPAIKDVKQPLIVNSKLGNVTDQGYAIGVNSIAELFYYKK